MSFNKEAFYCRRILSVRAKNVDLWRELSKYRHGGFEKQIPKWAIDFETTGSE